MSAPAKAIQSALKLEKDPKTKAVVEDARILAERIAHLKAAFEAEQTFRNAEEKELKDLLENVKHAMKDKDENASNAIKKRIIDKCALDHELIQKLNTAISSNKEANFSLKTNKLIFNNGKKVDGQIIDDGIIKGSERFLLKNWDTIVSTWNMPEGYGLQTASWDISYIGENAVTIHGSSKATYMKNAFALWNLAIDEKKSLQEMTYLKPQYYKNWLDDSSLFHLTPIPSIDFQEIDPRFKECTYLCDYSLVGKKGSALKSTEGQKGLSFAHSGYAYGGQRAESNRYAETSEKRKVNGPEDCSSWVSSISGCSQTYATLHQLWHYEHQYQAQFQQKPWEDVSAPDEWLKSENKKLKEEMEILYDPVIVRDPQRDIKAGQVYAFRGEGAHTVLLLGFKSDAENSKLVGLSYARNMPCEEGIGVQEFTPPNLEINKAKKAMIFSVNARGLEAQPFNLIESAPIYKPHAFVKK